VLAGTTAGALAGAILGLSGSAIEPSLRAALAVVLGLGAIAVAVIQLSGHRVGLFQLDRETPYRWLSPGAFSWALQNGAAIGFGAMTRLGFWLWYVIPIGAVLSGSWVVGGIGYGLYSLSRTLSAGGIMVLVRRADWKPETVLDLGLAARALSDMTLLCIGITAVFILGG
jgi:hypothetical protein